MRKAAFLDRDGVINASILLNGVPTPPRTLDEVVILEGAVEAIEMLKRNDYVPVVVTNQPDVARGITEVGQVEAINAKIASLTGLEHFYICYHDDAEACDCRKPKPGLLEKAVKEMEIDLSTSFLVGDRWRDIAAGLAVGVKCFFIDYSYGERLPEQPFVSVTSLQQAVDLIIGGSN